MPSMRVILLGTGTSHGVPMIACDCPVCTSPDPRDRRTRTCALVQTAGRSLLIDTPPELRVQCLACGVRRVDAVLYTHAHTDHVAGLDDLRRFNALQRCRIDCHGDAATLEVLRRMFPYAFVDLPDYPSAKPDLRTVEVNGPFSACGVPVTPIPLMHGPLPILGYRVGDFAYCTDCSAVPEASLGLLRGLDLLVIDGLRHRPHPTHFNLAQAVEIAGRIGARRTRFTHIAHELPHATTTAGLPEGMALAFDGETFEL